MADPFHGHALYPVDLGSDLGKRILVNGEIQGRGKAKNPDQTKGIIDDCPGRTEVNPAPGKVFPTAQGIDQGKGSIRIAWPVGQQGVNGHGHGIDAQITQGQFLINIHGPGPKRGKIYTLTLIHHPGRILIPAQFDKGAATVPGQLPCPGPGMAADGQIQISGPTAEKQIANRAADKIHPSGSGRGNGTQGFQDLARKEIPYPGASD
jgi:hypothetical protein